MIDLWGMVSDGLWVLGLALLLATLSWASWSASTLKSKLRIVLGQHAMQVTSNLGLILFSSGMAATERRWWAIVLWAALGIGFVVQLVLVCARSDKL